MALVVHDSLWVASFVGGLGRQELVEFRVMTWIRIKLNLVHQNVSNDAFHQKLFQAVVAHCIGKGLAPRFLRIPLLQK